MKRNAKSFFSRFEAEPRLSPKCQEPFRISRGSKEKKKVTPSQEMIPSFEKKGNVIPSLTKYQSYLQFINEGYLEIQEKKPLRQPYITHRKPDLNTSKTPILETAMIAVDDIQRRRSMLQRRRISPYLDKPVSLTKKQKSKPKKSYRNRRLYNSQDQTSKHCKDSVDQEKMHKCLFEGIQFFRDLGKGAHALVRSAIDWKNRRKIAVKVYKREELNEQELESIKFQIQILRSIRHPNIAQLYSVIETTQTINLLMEYGGGNSLFQHIRSKSAGHFKENEAKGLFRQILQAINYLHQRDIVHRDIKPQNILLNKANQVKIIDFGFSLVSGLADKIDTYCGTVTYMAPEIVTKRPHVGVFADRWSLGVLLYTLLQGAFPFRATTQGQLFSKISKGLFQYVVAISPEATKLIESFLVLKPSSRLSAKEALQSPWLNKV